MRKEDITLTDLCRYNCIRSLAALTNTSVVYGMCYCYFDGSDHPTLYSKAKEILATRLIARGGSALRLELERIGELKP